MTLFAPKYSNWFQREQKAEEKKKGSTLPLASMTLLILWLIMISPALACTKAPSQGSAACKDCILDQMKYSCPSCVPLLHCMARCLWGGTSRSKCVKTCDCNGGKPTLGQCKSCMSRCKCSCAA